MDPSRARRRDSGGIAGLRRYSTLFGVALAAFGLAEVGLFALQRSTSRWADHSREVARLAQTGYALALEREEMANAFLLSGGRMVPTPGEGSPAPVDSTLDSLVVLTADNPSQMARAREIGSTFRAWDTGFAAPALAGALSPAAAANLDKPLFAPLRTAFAEFLTAEDVLHEDRLGRSRILGWLALIGDVFSERHARRAGRGIRPAVRGAGRPTRGTTGTARRAGRRVGAAGGRAGDFRIPNWRRRPSQRTRLGNGPSTRHTVASGTPRSSTLRWSARRSGSRCSIPI